MVVFSPNFLDSGASICSVHQAHASTTKAPTLSRHVRAHTYIKYKRWDFSTHFLLGPQGQSYYEPKHSYQQNLKNLFYHNKIMLIGLCGRNVYTCTLQDAYVYGCDHGVQNVHMHDVGDVHEHVELVSLKIRFPVYYD